MGDCWDQHAGSYSLELDSIVVERVHASIQSEGEWPGVKANGIVDKLSSRTGEETVAR